MHYSKFPIRKTYLLSILLQHDVMNHQVFSQNYLFFIHCLCGICELRNFSAAFRRVYKQISKDPFMTNRRIGHGIRNIRYRIDINDFFPNHQNPKVPEFANTHNNLILAPVCPNVKIVHYQYYINCITYIYLLHTMNNLNGYIILL
jgi:hypothetical protein